MNQDFEFDDTQAEPAPPAPVVELRSYSPAISRSLPHSLEAEEALIGAIFADDSGGDVLAKCSTAGITPDSFYNPANALIFRAICDLRKAGQPVDTATVAESLKTTRELDAAGGFAHLVEVSSSQPTTAQAGFFVKRVADLALQRELIRSATGIVEDTYSLSDDVRTFAEVAAQRLRRVVDSSAIVEFRPRSLFDFPIVKDGDVSILLGNRYVNRGDGVVVSSSSGMGKSSISLQFATMYALEMNPFTIAGNGPLKSLIIQSEDSDGDVAEVAHSLRHILKLTDEQVALVNERVRIVSDRVNRGDKFIAALGRHIAEFKPDLVWINPLQAFIDGDVTDSQDLGRFLREGLNGLNRDAKFAYFVVHHTTKPATGKDRSERLWHEVMYDMAGGAEIINWARAIISIRPDKEEGEFNLVLAKRGKRAGAKLLKDHDGVKSWEHTTTIPLKHSTGRLEVPGLKNGLPIIFWEAREKTEGESESSGQHGGGSKNAKFHFTDYQNLFPAKTTAGLEIGPLQRVLSQNKEISKQALHSALKRWMGESHVEQIVEDGRPTRYRRQHN